MNNYRIIMLVAAVVSGFGVWFPQMQYVFFGHAGTDAASRPPIWNSLAVDLILSVVAVLLVVAGGPKASLPPWAAATCSVLSMPVVGMVSYELSRYYEVMKSRRGMPTGGVILSIAGAATIIVLGIVVAITGLLH